MKSFHSLIALLLLPFATTLRGENLTTEQILAKLDSAIVQGATYIDAKQQRVNRASQRALDAKELEERYWLNRDLYDEAFVFDADTAMAVVNRNIAIATRQRNPDRVNEWRIRKSFVMAATGLLKEAFDEISGIDPAELDEKTRNEYFSQMAYLYSHIGQNASGEMQQSYFEKSRAMEDSTIVNMSHDDSEYIWMMGWRASSSDDRRPVMSTLRHALDSAALDNRLDAMNAFALGTLYSIEENPDSAKYYLAMAALSDVRSANRDIASLRDLSEILAREDDIDRAFSYLNYAIRQALAYPARGRIVELSQISDNVSTLFRKRAEARQRRIEVFFGVILCLSVLLLSLALFMWNRIKKLNTIRQLLHEANDELNTQMAEIKRNHAELERLNEDLKRGNDEVLTANTALAEANRVKEQCISAAFQLCSDYINRMEKLRKEISRKVKARQFDDIQRLVSSGGSNKFELKDFYQNIDSIVLQIYPRFVEEFNSLLRPEERIVPREGELLNTTLRIYALVRLGISDSVKIAAMLHVSPQTVYNNRMTTRNKALGDPRTLGSRVAALDVDSSSGGE